MARKCKVGVGGAFTTADGGEANVPYIARLESDAWETLPGDALDGPVRALLAHDDLLYVGGDFGAARNDDDPAGASPATASVRTAVQLYPTPRPGDRLGGSSGVNVLAIGRAMGPERRANNRLS